MSKHWKELLDPSRHRDHRQDGSGVPRVSKMDNLVPQFAYFVRVCDFTFEFVSIEEMEQYLDYYSIKILPSSRKEIFEPEKGEWQSKFERLPLYLREESKRLKVVRALKTAIQDYTMNK